MGNHDFSCLMARGKIVHTPMWVFLRTKFLCTILALYSNIAAERFYSDNVPHVFCKTWRCHCKCQDSFCVCGFTRLHKEGLLLGLACVAVAPCIFLFPFPRTQMKHWNKHSRHCCCIRGSAENVLGRDVFTLVTPWSLPDAVMADLHNPRVPNVNADCFILQAGELFFCPSSF